MCGAACHQYSIAAERAKEIERAWSYVAFCASVRVLLAPVEFLCQSVSLKCVSTAMSRSPPLQQMLKIEGGDP